MLDGKHELCIVGENSYCQDAILEITGPKTPDGFFCPILPLGCDDAISDGYVGEEW